MQEDSLGVEQRQRSDVEAEGRGRGKMGGRRWRTEDGKRRT